MLKRNDDKRILDFLAGGGEMGELIRTYDWSRTPLGPIDSWPKSLRTCVQIMLTSRQPIWIGWGSDLIKLYNDPYKDIVKGKHPWALGKPASIVWKDIWRDIQPMLEKVMEHDEGTYVEEQLLIMERNGYPEETYYTFSYTPVAGDFGGTAGMICFNTDDTDRIISERQLKTLSDLGKSLGDLKSVGDAFGRTIDTLKTNPQDFPFAAIYDFQDGTATLLNSTAYGALHDRLGKVDLGADDEISRLFHEAWKSKKTQVMSDAQEKIGVMPAGSWEIPPDKVIVLPVTQGGIKDPYAFLLVGVNPYRLLDEKYLDFFHLVADQVATLLANIFAIEEERKRLEALSEIDRAKTVFFSNISHEFRTPLTLMLGSLEELMQQDEKMVSRDSRHKVEITHRNALRLLRLVNNLLDFSRIEAGREKARFQSLNISQYTRELAANFSSLIESAGLSYHIDMEPVSGPVYVDKVMWEKIVLNLLSNAFKYTLKGSVSVSLMQSGKSVTLKVRDTGVGIPATELPKMFARFHRIENNAGRSYEGTGIGLSLVSELVKLHSGTIAVTSEVGVGTEFTVSIPVGNEHFDPAQLVPAQPDVDSSLFDAFIEEAFPLLEDAIQKNDSVPAAKVADAEKILIVDDNPDMRNYMKSLLEGRFQVITANNGKEALHLIKADKPDLVVSDIMMPEMDGVQLMKTVKADAATQRLPVILLSARAGEEARIEGYEVGADDYLVKPFSAKELIARISSHINLARARDEVENNLRNVILQSPIATTLLRGPSFIIEIVNDMGLEVWGRTYEQVINKPIAVALPEVEQQGFVKLLEQVYNTGVPFRGNEFPVGLKRFGKPETVYLNFIYTPLRDARNHIVGVIGIGVDVSEQVYSRKAVEEAKASLDNAVELGELGTWEIDLTTNYTTYSARVAEWWGLPSEGANLDDIINCIDPEDRPKVIKAVEHAVERTGSYGAAYRLVHAVTKRERFIQAWGNVSYDQNNTPVKLSGIVRDVTMQKMTEQELERQVQMRTQQLEEVNADLQRSNNELMQFAYVASHDLQEPLRKIQTFSDIAQANLSDTDYVRTYLKKIDSSASRMASLIKDVLLYSQVGRDSRQEDLVDLNVVLENVKSDFELMIDQKEAVIKNQRLPVITGNKLQLHQLFSNLIGNSLKFSDDKPFIDITYRVTPGNEVDHPTLPHDNDYHVLTFSDNGIGFDQQYEEQIFRLFNRLHNRKDYNGTGIGLALCRKIVENHNGAIKASSAKGKGATFRVVLPVHQNLIR